MRACCTDTENQRLDVNTETMRVVSCRACGVRVIEWRVQPGRLGVQKAE